MKPKASIDPRAAACSPAWRYACVRARPAAGNLGPLWWEEYSIGGSRFDLPRARSRLLPVLIRSKPLSVRRLTVMLFLLALVSLKLVAVLRLAATPGGDAPVDLPLSFRGHSTFITSAPKAPNQRVAQGPALTQVKSTTRTPSSAFSVTAICSWVSAIASSEMTSRRQTIPPRWA